MARRRLAPAPVLSATSAAQNVPRAEHFDAPSTQPLTAAALPASAAPIARVAAEAASAAALDEVVETLRRAREEGRLVLEIPLDDIAADHIVRDRIGRTPRAPPRTRRWRRCACRCAPMGSGCRSK